MNNKNKQLFSNSFAIKKLLLAFSKQYNARRKKKKSPEVIKGKWYKDIKITEWAMLVTTIALTVGTLKLYNEAVNQSGISKKAVDAALRADSITLEIFEKSNSDLALDVTFVWRHAFRDKIGELSTIELVS